jgi:hypothetical protein
MMAALAATSIGVAGCDGGAAEVASPGVGGFPPAPPPPAPPPPPPPPGQTIPAADCSAAPGTTNTGTVAVPGGTQRVCALPNIITGSLTLPNTPGVVYSLNGRVTVGDDTGANPTAPIAGRNNGTLTILAGARIFGSSGADFLVVQRGSQIFANGEAANPVVFTSRQDIQGTDGPNDIGQFGGLVILGRAPINSCPATVEGGTVGCEAQVEGTNAFYGGATANDSSGRLEFVQVKYPGFEVSTNNELNGITLGGVGSNTIIQNVQVHNSSDDGIEWFGGRVSVRNIVITGADDDSLDYDAGWQGGIQRVIVIQRAAAGAAGGDRAVEGSSGSQNNDRLPRVQAQIANFTFVANAGTGEAVIFNQGSSNTLVNGIISGKSFCLDVDNNATIAQNPTFASVVFSCGTAVRDEADVPAAQILARINAGPNNNLTFTTSLVDRFINGNNEAAVTPSNPVTVTGNQFFQNLPYIGAVQNAADTTFRGWTCSLYPGGPTC